MNNNNNTNINTKKKWKKPKTPITPKATNTTSTNGATPTPNRDPNLILNLFQIYCTHFEPYTYTLVLDSLPPKLPNQITILLVCPEDRFPHLIGLDSIYSHTAKQLVDNIKANAYDVNQIETSFSEKFNNIQYKLDNFHLLPGIIHDCSAYKIFSLPGFTKCDYMLVKLFGTNELNLGIDINLQLQSYIPRTFLINRRPKYYGKFLGDSEEKVILRIERKENATDKVELIFDKELNENNNDVNIGNELKALGFMLDSTLIQKIIDYNNKDTYYNSVSSILNAYKGGTTVKPTLSILLGEIGDIFESQLVAKELAEKNTFSNIRIELSEKGYTTDEVLLSNIINFNRCSNKYHKFDDIITLYKDKQIEQSDLITLAKDIVEALEKQLQDKSKNVNIKRETAAATEQNDKK